MNDAAGTNVARPELRRVTGAQIVPYLADLAHLRVESMRDYPFLYDGEVGDEAAYLRRFAQSARSLIVLGIAGERVVGASTASPLTDELPALRAPFESAGLDPARIFFGGESALATEYRGSSVYRQFFLQREAHARELGAYDSFAFCAVERPEQHRLRPRDYQPLDATWARYGYTKHPELVAHMSWKDVDADAPTEKALVFWLKTLTAGPR